MCQAVFLDYGSNERRGVIQLKECKSDMSVGPYLGHDDNLQRGRLDHRSTTSQHEFDHQRQNNIIACSTRTHLYDGLFHMTRAIEHQWCSKV